MFSLALKLRTFLQLGLISLIAVSLIAPVSANPSDWGMVQRFNKQNELAQQGNVKAMYGVGKLYERGRGVVKNIQKAAEWYQKAASSGSASAQARLGILYFEGRGVNQDYNKALKLLNDAAKQNVPSALFQLANMYELGTGVQQDLKVSIGWYKKADEFGYYAAKAKVERLQKLLNTGGTIKRKASPQAVTKAKQATSPLIQTLLNGRWLKRKNPVGYLPSMISNCAKKSYSSMHCISTSQERSTGSEIITYNTESDINATGKKTFSIVYVNNVLEVATLAVEDGDGELIEKAPSRIKKGKQGKSRTLKCSLTKTKSLSCTKGSSNFEIISR